MKRITLSLLAGAGAWCAGCAGLQDSRVSASGHGMAEQAYRCQAARYANVCQPYDFEKGFIDGYMNVVDGEDGCSPPLPPKRYWGASYQNATGQDRVKAWYEGFRDGAAAAKQSGVGGYSSLYVPEEQLRDNDVSGAAGTAKPRSVFPKAAQPLPAAPPAPNVPDAKDSPAGKPAPATPNKDAAPLGSSSGWRPALPESLSPLDVPAHSAEVVKTSAEVPTDDIVARPAPWAPPEPLPPMASAAAEVDLGAPTPVR